MPTTERWRGAKNGARAVFACAVLAALVVPCVAQTRYGVGRAATRAEIAAWDIDVEPDGQNLPPGRGTVAHGREVYDAQCASCHGARGEGGVGDKLAGGMGTLGTDKPVKTVGSYWPYATTLYDYTYRAMPFTQPGSLTPDETYSLVAYLLSLNGVIPEGAVMDKATLPKVAMPAHDHFVPDNRKGGPAVK